MTGRSLASRLALLLQATTVLAVLAFAGSSLWITARVLRREDTARLEATARHVADNLDREYAEERDFGRAAASALL